MRYRLTFIAGLALGYVLGTRAGRERYEQLKKSARQVAQNPAVRNATESATHNGRDFAEKAFHTVS
ncbi:YtxH domain-containing protein, partial [Streptomyces chryseus]